MAPPNGTTVKAGQAVPRRAGTGLHKPVVPAIPFAYLPQQQRRKQAPVSVAESTPVQEPKEPTQDETTPTPISTVTQSDSGINDSETTGVTDKPTTSSAVHPDNQTQTSEPEVTTPSSPVNMLAPAHGQLATPPSDMITKRSAGTCTNP